MRKKILISLFFILIILVLIPISVSFAADHTISEGTVEPYDISLHNDNDIITIATTEPVTLTGTKKVQIVCNPGTNLILDNVAIEFNPTFAGSDRDMCAISFTFIGNTLTLVGTSTITSGPNEPGIRVEDGAELTINGTGTLNVTGGYGGAGIGGGYKGYVGTIKISGGTVTATGGSGGAGIGGGSHGNGGTIDISGGTITATGDGGAGIGGGFVGNGGTINISGGTVTATCGFDGAGIGGGYEGNGGTVNISGGIVYAKRAMYSYAQDIGNGGYRDGKPDSGTLQISGDAVVFLDNQKDNSVLATTIYHGYLDYDEASDVSSGYNVPSDWSYPIGAYKPIEVSVSPDTVTLGFGETVTLTAMTNPEGYPVRFYSREPSIATVDRDTGLVTAGMKEGRAIITAMYGQSRAECVIYVVDKDEPAPKPSDPKNSVSVQIKDELGNPQAGIYVSLFSDPQTVVTDSNGMAVFHNVPYNTNDPHTLIIQDDFGNEIQRYSLSFISGQVASTSIEEGNINITFDNRVNNTNIAFTMVEDRIDKVMVSLGYKPQVVERVENPETGEDFASELLLIEFGILIVFVISRVLMKLTKQNL